MSSPPPPPVPPMSVQLSPTMRKANAERDVVNVVNPVHNEDSVPTAIPIDVRSKEYLQKLNQQPAGLVQHMQDITEIPHNAMNRVLMEGEVIVSDFDCYFPHKMLPMWKIILYCVLTGGLYLLVLLYRLIQRCCYRMKCCTPKTVEFIRGKLAVTSMGRMICWAQEGTQEKYDRPCWFNFLCCCCKLCCADTCAAPTSYDLKIVTAVHSIDAIREISQFYGTKSQFLCWCNSYIAGVKISFNHFDHHGKSVPSYVYTGNHGTYKLLFDLGERLEAAATFFEHFLFFTSSDVVYLTSQNGDMMHMHDHASAVEDAATLYARFLDCLPPRPEIVVENPELNATKRFNTAKELTVTVVGDDGTVTLPTKLFSLMTGEKVIACAGQVYTMGTMEWIKSILTLGLYYIFHVRERKFLRSAIVLTNKRIFVLDIVQRAGTIPKTMSNFCFQVTSYFPGAITSGYMCSQSKSWLHVAIGTAGGGIFFDLFKRERSLPFAKAVQLSTYRLGTVVTLKADKERKTPHLIPSDAALVALFANETLIDGLEGNISFEPFCFMKKCSALCCPTNASSGEEEDNAPLCSPDVLGKCLFPWLPYWCTCALRPFQSRNDLYISENTMFLIRRSGNFGLCGFLCSENKPCCTGPCAKSDWIIISWVAVKDVQGHQTIISSEGHETIVRRCCKNQICGHCCPISHNEMLLSVYTPIGSFSITETEHNHDFSKDANLRNMVATLDAVERSNYLHAMRR